MSRIVTPAEAKALLVASRNGRARKGPRPKPRINTACYRCGAEIQIVEGATRVQRFCGRACQAEARKVPMPVFAELEHMYLRDERSANDIAREYGVSDTTVGKWLRAYGIRVRTIGEGVSIAQMGHTNHTDASRAAIGARIAASWADGRRTGQPIPAGRFKSKRSRGGLRPDLGLYLRSSWESNYLRYLIYLKTLGAIRSWAYEPRTFRFHGITRGQMFYTPDFRVEYHDGRVEWHEVKGYMDAKSQTKLKRMAEFYPTEVVRVIDREWFRTVGRSVRGMIRGWER